VATTTPEKLDALTDGAEPDGLYEIIDGRIVEKTTGVYENWLAALIYGLLERYARQTRIGRAVVEMIFDFRPRIDRDRRPDVAFVSFERWAPDRRRPRTRSWEVVPDLAVEVVSRTNSAEEVAEKMQEYYQVGVRLVWVVYPVQMKVYAHTSAYNFFNLVLTSQNPQINFR
jgi:Uma2 family endonuclease